MTPTIKQTVVYVKVDTIEAPVIPNAGMAHTFSAMFRTVAATQAPITIFGYPMLFRNCTDTVSRAKKNIPGSNHTNAVAAGRKAGPNNSLITGEAVSAAITSRGKRTAAVLAVLRIAKRNFSLESFCIESFGNKM